MCRLGLRVSNAVKAIGWDGLTHFTQHLPPDSALWRSQHEDDARYASPLQAAAIAADTYDLLARFLWVFVSAHTPKNKVRPPEPEPYPRPWVKDKSRQHIGGDAISVADFNDWYYS